MLRGFLEPRNMCDLKELSIFLWKDGLGGKIMIGLVLAALVLLPCLVCRFVYFEYFDINPYIQNSNGVEYMIDTLSINGVQHEFIVTGNLRHLDVGRAYLTHSPECSCKKPQK